MGGGKLPPRQKMIGMMYLVLTALLAMNVSKDILNAFVVVNESLERTNHNFDEKNKITYDAFKKAMNDEKSKAKAQPYNDMALKVQKLSKEMNEYIEKLKVHLIMQTDKCPEDSAKAWAVNLMAVNAKDNYDIPTQILIGDGLENPHPATVPNSASELEAKISKYRDEVLAIFNDTKKFEYNKNVKQDMANRVGLVLKGGMENGVQTTWAGINFYHLPLAAVITNLTKVQADIRNAEAESINEIFKGIEGADFKFDKLVAKVIAPSSYIIQGDKFTADVLLVAFNSTSNPEIVVGPVDTTRANPEKDPMKGPGEKIPVMGGLGKYERAAGAEGFQKWGGCIKVPTPGGGFKYYPFMHEYQVAKPGVSVSADAMNVFYIGVPNPVSVSAAGISNENLSVSMSGGSINIDKRTGKGTVNVTSPGEATINVSAKMGSATKSLGSSKFRVKRIPDPVAMVLGKKDGSMSKSELKAAGAIIAKLENFVFDAKASVTSFTLSAAVGGGEYKDIRCTGGNFTPEVISAIDRAKGKVIFEEIKAKMPDGSTRNIPPVVFKLK